MNNVYARLTLTTGWLEQYIIEENSQDEKPAYKGIVTIIASITIASLLKVVG